MGNVTFSYRGRDTRSGKTVAGHTYSGALKVGERLLVPYGISDSAVGFATVTIADLLDLMV